MVVDLVAVATEVHQAAVDMVVHQVEAHMVVHLVAVDMEEAQEVKKVMNWCGGIMIHKINLLMFRWRRWLWRVIRWRWIRRIKWRWIRWFVRWKKKCSSFWRLLNSYQVPLRLF